MWAPPREGHDGRQRAERPFLAVRGRGDVLQKTSLSGDPGDHVRHHAPRGLVWHVPFQGLPSVHVCGPHRAASSKRGRPRPTCAAHLFPGTPGPA